MLVPSAFGPARPRGAEVHGVRDTWVCAVWGFLDRDSHVPGQSCQLSPGGGGWQVKGPVSFWHLGCQVTASGSSE